MKKNKLLIYVQVALLIAIEIVLNRFCSINTWGLKIGFSFVPIALCAMLHGPYMAAACYALADFLGATLFPIGPYHPGFTLCAAAMGFVYGIFLYRGGLHLGRQQLIPARQTLSLFSNYLPPTLINCAVIGLFINTFWVTMLYSSRGYWGWFLYRFAQELILIPLNLLLLPVLDRLCKRLSAMGLTRD